MKPDDHVTPDDDTSDRGFWVRLDQGLARLRRHRVGLSLLIDGFVIALAWNVTYLFRLGFERWWSARPGYDGWVLWSPGSKYEIFLPALEKTLVTRKKR